MLLPDASSFVPSTAAIFVRLMIASPTILLVGDATAAFYHVRVYGSQMLLYAGSDVFVSDRLTFGVNVGPAGLASSLCASEEELACHFGSDLFELVVDDYMFADRTVKVPVRDLSLWLNTLEAGGQHTPYRKFSALSTPELREELQKALSDRGVTCSVEETGKYLGVNLRFSGGSLVLVCERLARLNQAADNAERY
ncbi:hypothetical protein Pmar_PMAR025277 [Perkinsus marinus ATCC 50983]|uniref:Uncharacterized protein n=1 Tax=Perkinsus marinus (strain ATCC 50983 / TXsc) TaxID=423536 RepID=C5M1K8_PERM5|nr:hypothetical protein Pmar_PMAR025277 [Perkinsus marinus ATCC 50983]EEQ97134.1 hypothetical protein Pmar_PMAR025277 [Perkinsus marinus ATCC 50983]|eukprot:XP_002764417.1 hypothetical protein Pmar_PMAR025277 [Perkinsus marinus ATCC 50983]